jgi:hypothetical protein
MGRGAQVKGAQMSRPFLKGLELGRILYETSVESILSRHFPGLSYSAALIGRGSEVLGFDTPQSTDHDWGPRLMLFLSDEDYGRREQIDRILCRELPPQICGYPTRYALHDDGTAVMALPGDDALEHRITFHTVRRFFRYVLNWDIDEELRALDWLTIPEQTLRSLTTGRVYHDGLGQLEPIRAKLSYYPRDIWLYLLANQWRRIGQEEAFMGRCGQVDDDLGSRLVAARLVRDLMRLCFLMERQYAPYIKWLGTAFRSLDCGEVLTPILTSALGAATWQERERHLSVAYERVAHMHNDLGMTEPLATAVSQFHSRPFLVPHADRFAEALLAMVESQEVRALPAYLGGIDQYVDSTDALTGPQRIAKLKAMYQEP